MARYVLPWSADSGNRGGYCKVLDVIAATAGTVTAFDTAGNESIPSNTACATTPRR